MHVELAVLAFVVVPAAAVYSTWSPCGLSMLSQLTPVAERARGNRFHVTAIWFLLGALAGGATLGAGIAALAALMRVAGISTTFATAGAAAAMLWCAALDAGLLPWTPPFLRRQVNEDWLTSYRSWVYGLGFGWQIGAGLTTYIMTSALFALIVVGALSASPFVGLASGVTFALVRGLAVFASASCTTYNELLALHRRMEHAGPLVQRAVVAVLVVGAAVAATFAFGGLGLVAVGACAGIAARPGRRAPSVRSSLVRRRQVTGAQPEG